MIDLFNLYGRELVDAYRIVQSTDAPPRAPEGKLWLYLCVFGDRAKIGVSIDCGARIKTHERHAGSAIEVAYLILLDKADARKREASISFVLGRDQNRGASREWFPKEHAWIAALEMGTPGMLMVWNYFRNRQSSFAKGEHDNAFELKLLWGKPLKEAA